MHNSDQVLTSSAVAEQPEPEQPEQPCLKINQNQNKQSNLAC